MKYLILWVVGCLLIIVFLLSYTPARSFLVYYPKSEIMLDVVKAKCPDKDSSPNVVAFQLSYEIYHQGRFGGSWRPIRTLLKNTSWYRWDLENSKIEVISTSDLSNWLDCYPYNIGLVRSVKPEFELSGPFIQSQAWGIRDLIDDKTFLFGYYNRDTVQFYSVEFEKLGIPSPEEFDIKLF